MIDYDRDCVLVEQEALEAELESLGYRGMARKYRLNPFYVYTYFNDRDYKLPDWVLRRLGRKKPPPPRIAIRKDDAASAARSIRRNCKPGYVKELIRELGG